MKKNEKLLFAIGDIDDCMVDAAYNKENNKKSRSGVFEIIGAVAAVAAIAVFAVVLSHFAQKKPNISAGTDAVTGDGITTVTDDNKTTVTDDGIIDSIKDDNVELINIKDIKEISGDYHYVSVGEREWESVTIGMTLSEILNSDVVSYNLPSLMPEGYILLHTGMDVANDHIENSRSLTLIFIDNVNNAVEEHRDESGNVIYNKDKYNSLGLTLYNKSKYEGIEHITKKWLLTKSLSAEYLYKDFYEENADGHTEYTFLIETDEYYILYEYRGCEGGERNLNCKNLYQIAASTPYIKDNGYKYTGDEIKARDGVFMTAEELEGVTAIHVTSLPGSYDFKFNGADEVKPITDYLSSLHPVSVYTNKVCDEDGMTWVIELTYGDKTKKTLYHMGTYIKEDGGALYELEYEEANKFGSIVKSAGQSEVSGLSSVVFMTEDELEGVTKIHVTDLSEKKTYEIEGTNVKKITDSLASLCLISTIGTDSSILPVTSSGIDVMSSGLNMKLLYNDGTVKEFFIVRFAGIYDYDENKQRYAVNSDDIKELDSIINNLEEKKVISDTAENTQDDEKIIERFLSLLKENGTTDGTRYTKQNDIKSIEKYSVQHSYLLEKQIPGVYIISENTKKFIMVNDMIFTPVGGGFDTVSIGMCDYNKDGIIDISVSVSGGSGMSYSYDYTIDLTEMKIVNTHSYNPYLNTHSEDTTEVSGLSKVVFMTEDELEGVERIRVTSDRPGYEYRFEREETEPIKDFLTSLRAVYVSDRLKEDVYGGCNIIELYYADGKTLKIYYVNYAYIVKDDGSGQIYILNDEIPDKLGEILSASYNYAQKIPDDFSFTLSWGPGYDGYYDSKSNKLVKMTTASDPSKYTTSYKMTDGELTRVYNALKIIEKIPEYYDPYNDPNSDNKIGTEPSDNIKVTMTANGNKKTVICEDVCVAGEGYDETAKQFLSAVKLIQEILYNTQEWKALPEYESLYY